MASQIADLNVAIVPDNRAEDAVMSTMGQRPATLNLRNVRPFTDPMLKDHDKDQRIPSNIAYYVRLFLMECQLRLS